ncbi:hypothetical protein F4677DRAFT_438977 [Hypoxylon crocopeplum]|nr:hypothetical protein F4677DRAFT_438977 [Hypoxylon crocopeplum]
MNTKGTFLSTKALLPTANRSNAAVLAATTRITGLPTSMLPGLSTYMAAKPDRVPCIGAAKPSGCYCSPWNGRDSHIQQDRRKGSLHPWIRES